MLPARRLSFIALLCGLWVQLVFVPGQVQAKATDNYNIGLQAYQLKNYTGAFNAWKLGAFEGDAEAQYNLGVLYIEGKGAPRDPEKAHYWFLRAAGQQHPEAQYNLGHLYIEGLGVQADGQEGMSWWRMASDNGYSLAAYNLGRAYYAGLNGEVDLTKAKQWFEVAAQQGEPRSKEFLEVYAAQFSGSTASQEGLPAEKLALNRLGVKFDTQKLEIQRPKQLNEDLQPAEEIKKVDNTLQAQNTAPNSKQSKQVLVDSETSTQTNPIATAPQYVTTPRRLVKVYAAPRSSDLALMQLNPGTLLKALDSQKQHIRVQRPLGFPVWLKASSIDFGDQVFHQLLLPTSFYYAADSKPDGQFAIGETVSLLGQIGQWVKVLSPPSLSGWVGKSDIVAAKDQNVLSLRWQEQLERRFRTATFAPKILHASDDEHKAESIKSQADSTFNTVTVVDLSSSLKNATKEQSASSVIRTGDEAVSQIGSARLNDNAWLFNQSDDSMVIHLFTLKNAENAFSLASSKLFLGRSALYSTQIKNVTWYFLLQGPYPTQERAETAKAALPKQYSKGSKIRSLSTIAQSRCKKRSSLSRQQASELSIYCVN